MSKFRPCVLVFVLAISGCSTVKDPNDPSMTYRVSYKDTNHDGYIDRAYYEWNGSDGDYSFEDTDFDGSYDECTVYGFGISSKPVDIPVYLDAQKRKLNKSFLNPP